MREVKLNNELLESDSSLEELNFLAKEGDDYLCFSVYPEWGKANGYKCMTFKVKLTDADLEKGDEIVYDKLTDNIKDDLEYPTMLEAIKAGFSFCGKKLSKKLNVFTGSMEEAAKKTRKGDITAVRIPDYL